MTTQPAVLSMSARMLQQLRPALLVCLLLTVLTGVVYPLVVTLLAQTLFPHEANGSLLDASGRPASDVSHAVGSSLIGQGFDRPQYFWPRPSATSPVPYTAFNADKGTGSSGSNLSPANPAFVDAVKARLEALHQADSANPAPIPVDLVTASASGLDPHESVAAAEYQIPRIARIRGVEPAKIQALVAAHTQGRMFGILGEKTVLVLPLNLALDRAFPFTASAASPVPDLPAGAEAGSQGSR